MRVSVRTTTNNDSILDTAGIISLTFEVDPDDPSQDITVYPRADHITVSVDAPRIRIEPLAANQVAIAPCDN